MKTRNAFYAQSGGVTAVINASACGVIETARTPRRPDRQGLRRPQRHHRRADRGPDRHLARSRPRRSPALRSTPSGAFGSCRFKLKSLEANRREYERLIEVFKAHDIGYFFYNGGGDSADTCFKVSQLSAAMGYPLQAIHVPKTVDNDLPITDCCPGFGSVAKYVAVSTLEASFDVRSMAQDVDQGLRARGDGPACGLDRRRRRPGRGPRHPGRDPVPRDRVRQNEVHRARRRARQGARLLHGRRLRGLPPPDGTFLAEQGTRDAFGHAQLGGAAPVVANMVKQALGYKFHWAVADYLQRAARHIASKTDVKQAYELGQEGGRARARGPERGDADGRADVRRALQVSDRHGGARRRSRTSRSSCRATSSPRTVSASPKLCKRYLKPLIQGEDHPKYKDGLPVYVTLRNVAVPKKLGAFELK